MTLPNQPQPSVGELRADMRVDTDEVGRDVERGLRDAGPEAEDGGEYLGGRASEGFGRGWRRSIADEIRDGMAEALAATTAREREVTDVLSNLLEEIVARDRERRRRTAAKAGSDTAAGFFGGFANTLQNLITSPLAAIFNVSARSPLIVLLIPVLGAIVALITAAVYGLQALASQLFLIPSLLFAVGLQGLSLFLIFNDVATVAGAVLQAQNAQELADALKGVNTELADVLKQLIPWRDLFRELEDIAKTAFFGAIGDQLTQILDNIRGPLTGAIATISAGLGGALASFLDAFTTPEFAQFLELISAETGRWLEGFGPALNTFVTGLTDLGIAMMPFVSLFGDAFNKTLTEFGEWLSGLGENEEFMDWMRESIPVIKDFLQFLGGLWDLVKEIIKAFSEADQEIQREQGGASFLDTLTFYIKQFIDFISSESGKDAMKTFIALIGGLTGAFIALAIAIGYIMAALSGILELFFKIGNWIKENFFGGGTGKGGKGGGGPLHDAMAAIQETGETVAAAFSTALLEFQGLVGGIITTVSAWFVSAREVIQQQLAGVRDDIISAIPNPLGLLFTAGENILNGLMNGIRNRLTPLRTLMNEVAGVVRNVWPFSPAKTGPLSGHGDLRFAGQEIINRLITGVQMETPNLASTMNSAASSVVFGAGSVQVMYQGGMPPTQQQSQMMGMAAGQGILDQLIGTQLAVRTM